MFLFIYESFQYAEDYNAEFDRVKEIFLIIYFPAWKLNINLSRDIAASLRLINKNGWRVNIFKIAMFFQSNT